jgi:type VI protein secretion system component Hcp
MALIGRMQVIGSRQGVFKGECFDAKWRGFFPIVALQSEGELPGFDISKQTDPSSPSLFQNSATAETFEFGFQIGNPVDNTGGGKPKGKRPHGPLKVGKQWGAASPLLLQAVCNSENLLRVIIHIVEVDPTGSDTIVHSLVLSNAVIQGMQPVASRTGRSLQSFTFISEDITAILPPPSLPDEVVWRLPPLIRR